MWGNVYSKFYEEQAGFREKYCTVDQIFVLNSVRSTEIFEQAERKVLLCICRFFNSF